MKTFGTRLRRQFQPLTLGAKLICYSPYSPLTQSYDPKTSQYIPDRTQEGFNLKLVPVISASVSDDSLKGLSGNAYIANPVFYMDGKKMTVTMGNDTSDYNLEEDETYKYILSINRNFPTGSSHSIWMEADFQDPRTEETLKLKTDIVTITTSAMAADNYLFSFGGSKNIIYDPLSDTRLEAEYLTAHGVPTEDPDDGSGYMCTLNFQLMKGSEKVTDYTVKAFSTKNEKTTEITDLSKGVVQGLTKNSITIDLRVCETEWISIAGYITTKNSEGKNVVTEVARASLCSTGRARQPYIIKMMNEEDIYPTAERHIDWVVVNYNGKVLKAPENVIDIVWRTNTAAKEDVTVGYNAYVDYPLQKTGVGDTYARGWIEQYIEHQHKEPYALAVDTSTTGTVDYWTNGEVQWDKDGNPTVKSRADEFFIIN